MPAPSLVDIIDTLSPLVTLGFGVFCAISDTKPKDGKMSRAGKIALWGLIISGSISLVVKTNSLRVKLKEEEENAISQEHQRIKKEHEDSVHAAFEKATSDTLSSSVKELNNIKSSSQTTLQSLNIVAAEQQASLNNTRRGLNPLFPLKLKIHLEINMNGFYKKYPSTDYRKDISLYLDTLVYFATKAQIPELIRQSNHTGKPLDTINLPAITTIDPLFNHIPDEVRQRFEYARYTFAGLFLPNGFTINLRKNQETNSQLTLRFDLGNAFAKLLQNGSTGSNEIDEVSVSADMSTGLIQLDIALENPAITSTGTSTDFISLYDLQDGILGLHVDGIINDPAIIDFANISFYTGYQFSRTTGFDLHPANVKDVCCTEVYARKIIAEEIK